jgi:predicted site-specific integrase-resolvase
MGLIAIAGAAALLGVSVVTLRRWEARGVLVPQCRTPGGHRRYETGALLRLRGDPVATAASDAPVPGGTAVYARVSSRKQADQGDLQRQLERLTRWCAARGVVPVAFTDVGSGLNPRRAGLQRLVRAIRAGRVRTVVVEHRDRLTRFGFLYLEQWFAEFGARVALVEDLATQGPGEALCEDIMALIASFSGKYYRLRQSRRTGGGGAPPPTAA